MQLHAGIAFRSDAGESVKVLRLEDAREGQCRRASCTRTERGLTERGMTSDPACLHSGVLLSEKGATAALCTGLDPHRMCSLRTSQ